MTILSQFTVPWRNSSSATCPPYGVFQITGWEDLNGTFGLIGATPSQSLTGPLAINGYGQVKQNKTGRCNTSQWPCWAAYSGSNVPKAGEPYGTQTTYTIALFTGADYVCLGAKNSNSGLNLILVQPCEQKIWQAKSSGVITHSTVTGQFKPMFDGAVVSGVTKTLEFNHADGNKNISADKDLYVKWSLDKRAWLVLGADCE